MEGESGLYDARSSSSKLSWVAYGWPERAHKMWGVMMYARERRTTVPVDNNPSRGGVITHQRHYQGIDNRWTQQAFRSRYRLNYEETW